MIERDNLILLKSYIISQYGIYGTDFIVSKQTYMYASSFLVVFGSILNDS
jgi:hypothetical protein